MIPYSKQYIDKKDIKAVNKILESKFITQGPEVERFEKKICDLVGAKYSIAVSSCSAGLHLSALACGIKKNKKILTTPNTFCSTANAALHCGAEVIFSDIDINTGNINIDNVINILKKKKIDAFIPVHFGGLAVNLNLIKALSKKKNFYIIEDAAHALGSEYLDGSKVGSCRYSDMTVFSFHPVKSITTGEGGVITTNSKKLYERIKILRSHGIEKDKKLLSKGKDLPWYYEVKDLGFHYRTNDILCSLGISQLKKLNKFISYRKKVAKYYDIAFSKFKNCIPLQLNMRNKSANHLYVLKINFKKIKISRKQVMNKLKSKGIITQVHYIPVNMHPFYLKNRPSKKINLKMSKKYYSECLSIPIYYKLSKNQQNYIIRNLKAIIE